MLLRIGLLVGIALRLAAAAPPLIDYVTYLGGSYADTVVGIAVDSGGSAYVAGNTVSPDFPVTSTSLGTPSTNGCAFVTKFNSSGTAIDFSVCLANIGADRFRCWMQAATCIWRSRTWITVGLFPFPW